MKFNVIFPGTMMVILSIVALAVSCKRTDGPLPSTDPPKELISLEKANQMYKAYQARFKAVTDFRDGKEDARYGWHSIDFYKNYIAYLEAEAKKANIKISGLRLYYVAYPDDESAGEYRNYQTYIYVPTYYDEKTKRHIAFDPTYLGDGGTPVPIHNIITDTTSLKTMARESVVAATETTSSKGAAANMGEMCKPNCSE